MDALLAERLPPISDGQHDDGHGEREMHALVGPIAPRKQHGPRYQSRSMVPSKPMKLHQGVRNVGVDSWPAHASSPDNLGTSLVMTKDKRMVVLRHPSAITASKSTKPRFLEYLESFLREELKYLGVSEIRPSELRLQAYRQVFEHLIEDFKTYKPLLSSIKNEYEMMLSAQREEIRRLEPLRQMLVTVAEESDQRIMDLREEEKQDIVDLKNEKEALNHKIESMRNYQVSLEVQVEKLREELAVEYMRYRDECDARKILISDINDLKYQQEDISLTKKDELDDTDYGDPLTLKIALKKAREDEMKASQRLLYIEATYGDVIPRREYETLEKQFKELMASFQQTQEDFTKLKDEHDVLLDLHKQTLAQRDEYYAESETLRRSSTPRPKWDRCADIVAGGIGRWTTLSTNKTTDQLVEVLLNEIAGSGGSDAAGAEYFDGMGMEEGIPKYLQFEGKVRNRRLGKRDCLLLIKDIWREKAAHDAEQEENTETRVKSSEFLQTYLERRFSLPQMIIEWAYNVNDACMRYSHDDAINMFALVLNGEMDEEIYHDQLDGVTKLLGHLTKLDVENGNPGTLSKLEFQESLGQYFPDKSQENVMALLALAEKELEAKETDDLEYKNLFMEDDEGKTGPFLVELKKQWKQDRHDYVDDIKKELAALTKVSVEDLKKAMSTTDPEIDHDDMDRYLCWTFMVETKEALEEVEPFDLDPLIIRLKNGNLKRIGKKPT